MSLVIDIATQYQTVEGFGLDMACIDSVVSDTVADLLWSPTAGIGISWCRLRASVADGSIPGWGVPTDGVGPDGTPMSNAGMVASAIKARDRGARFWALADGENSTPGSWITAGRLDPARYADYAASFKKIVSAGAALGINVEYVSVWNEPDLSTAYINSGTMLHDVIAQAPAGSPLLLVGETAYASHEASYVDPTLNDAVTRAKVYAAASHVYYGAPLTYATPAGYGIGNWQTEYNPAGDTGGATAAGDMGDALRGAQKVHDCLTNGYTCFSWFLAACLPGWTDQGWGLLGINYALTKRYHAFGNYTKFVRPGSVRVAATGAPAGVYATAYRAVNGSLILVVVNSNASATPLDVTGFGAARATPWITDATRDLAAQPGVTIPGGAFSYSLPAQSVTTFVQDAMFTQTAAQVVAVGVAASQDAAYQPAGRLTVAADPVVSSQTTLRGHRVPGSTVYVTR